MRKWIVFKKEKGLLHKLFSPLKAVKVNESYVKKMECFTQKKNRDVTILNKYCYNFFYYFLNVEVEIKYSILNICSLLKKKKEEENWIYDIDGLLNLPHLPTCRKCCTRANSLRGNLRIDSPQGLTHLGPSPYQKET